MDPAKPAAHGAPVPAAWAGLPRELLHNIYRQMEFVDGRPMTHDDDLLRESVTGQAVCRHWRRALRDLPLGVCLHADSPHGLLEWLLSRQPPVAQLQLCDHPGLTEGLARAVLRSLPAQVLQELWWHTAWQLPAVLPNPGVLPALRYLSVMDFAWDEHWLRLLGGLQLERLMLDDCQWAAGSDARAQRLPMVLPPLCHLTHAEIEPSWTSTIRLAPADFPSLLELTVHSFPGRAEIVATPGGGAAQGGSRGCEGGGDGCSASGGGSGGGSSSSSALTYLCFLGSAASSVDFAALPALRSAQLMGNGMQGVGTLGAATALTSLRLGHLGGELSPWAASALRAAPTTLRRLGLRGNWGREEAAAVGGMGQLQLLELDGRGKEGSHHSQPAPPLPPAGAAVWRSLRAFLFFTDDGSPKVPAGLRHTTQLVRLSLDSPKLSREEVVMLASLPALRRLFVALDEGELQTIEALRQALPERVELFMTLVGTDDPRVHKQLQEFMDRFFDGADVLGD